MIHSVYLENGHYNLMYVLLILDRTAFTLYSTTGYRIIDLNIYTLILFITTSIHL